MPNALKAVRREMLRLEPRLGRVESIASGTATTIVSASLQTGTVSAGKFADLWAVRGDAAATADRVRLITDTGFASSTGTLTHAGPNYTNNPTSAETLELLTYEPYRYWVAIDRHLRSMRRQDRTIIPTRYGQRRYWLSDLSWIASPRDVLRVCYSPQRVLSRNRYFEKYGSVDSGGLPLPDYWTLAGAAATMARSATQVSTGQYAMALTRSGTDCTLTQSVTLLPTAASGSGAASLVGFAVNVVLVGYSAAASQLRAFIDDGVTVTRTAYHAGNSAFAELTTSATVGATATKLNFGVEDNGSNTVCYADDCYLVWGGLDDAVRLDAQPEQDIGYSFDQGAGTLALILESDYGFGGQIVVYSTRPYPSFDATRLQTLAADADTTDAPLEEIATGAIWRLYRGLPQTPEIAKIAGEWGQRAETLALGHLYTKNDRELGIDLPLQLLGGSARRF